jgi:hypothetical protein
MPTPDDDERMDDLAATSDSLREDAREVVDIEEEKQDLDPGDPRLTTLSREAERLAGQVQQKSRIERDLAEKVNGNDEPPRPSN